MFNLDWADPEVRWLVITNWTLFAVTIICVAVVAYGVAVEILKRVRQPHTADDHAVLVPDLGLTMADGGEQAKNRNRLK
jgi:hypothetical protein